MPTQTGASHGGSGAVPLCCLATVKLSLLLRAFRFLESFPVYSIACVDIKPETTIREQGELSIHGFPHVPIPLYRYSTSGIASLASMTSLAIILSIRAGKQDIIKRFGFLIAKWTRLILC